MNRNHAPKGNSKVEAPEHVNVRGVRLFDDASSCVPDFEDLGPYDILCGRGRSAWNNVGNRRFRVTVHLNLPRYMRAPTKHDKTLVIISVVKMLREEVGARFLKRGKDGVLIEMDEKQVKKLWHLFILHKRYLQVLLIYCTLYCS